MIRRIQNSWLCPLFAREYTLMSFDTLQLYSLSLKQPTLIPDHPCHDCFHVHIMTWRVLLSSFLGLLGCFTHFLPAFQQRLKATCRPERRKVGSQGLTRHRGQLTLVPAVPQSLWRGQPSPHTMCAVRKPEVPSTSYVELSTRLLSVRAGLEDSLSFLVLSFKSFICAPEQRRLQLIPGHAGKAHCSA